MPVQVGSWEGRSAVWAIQHICVSEGSRLVCIDTWRGAPQYSADAKVNVFDSSSSLGNCMSGTVAAGLCGQLTIPAFANIKQIKV